MKQSTTITSKGQVTIPVDIRRQLGLKPGQSVRFEIENGRIVVNTDDWQANLAKIHKRVANHMQKRNLKSLNDQELDEAINQASQKSAANRYQKISQK